MKLTLIDKKPEAQDAITFKFKPQEPLNFKPGQYLRYIFNHPNPDDRGLNRFFSISAAPYEGVDQITTRFAPEKGSSFKTALKNLEPGAEIEATGPLGQFTLDDPTKKYVFIAGGIGITPFRSMILQLDHDSKPINIKLLYANRTPDAVFKDEFEAVKSRHPEFQIKYFIGDQKIDEAAIKAEVPNLQEPIFYVSGPEPMVEAFEKMLMDMGIPDENIKRDFFPGYTQI